MTSKTQAVFDWVFQSNSLQKKEKHEFVSLMEETLDVYGFKKVTKIFGGERKYSKSIRFEKLIVDKGGQWIEFVFDKYEQRKFYVTVGVSETFFPNKHLLVGHVVRRKNDNQSWYGSQWSSIFRRRAWLKATKYVSNQIPKLVSYLDEVELDEEIHHYIVPEAL